MALSAEEVVKGHLKGQELEQKIVEISAKAINDYKNSTKEYSKTYYKHQGREYSPDRDAARDQDVSIKYDSETFNFASRWSEEGEKEAINKSVDFFMSSMERDIKRFEEYKKEAGHYWTEVEARRFAQAKMEFWIEDQKPSDDEWNAFKSWAKKKLKALLSEKFPGFENNKEVGYAASFSKKEWVN